MGNKVVSSVPPSPSDSVEVPPEDRAQVEPEESILTNKQYREVTQKTSSNFRDLTDAFTQFRSAITRDVEGGRRIEEIKRLLFSEQSFGSGFSPLDLLRDLLVAGMKVRESSLTSPQCSLCRNRFGGARKVRGCAVCGGAYCSECIKFPFPFALQQSVQPRASPTPNASILTCRPCNLVLNKWKFQNTVQHFRPPTVLFHADLSGLRDTIEQGIPQFHGLVFTLRDMVDSSSASSASEIAARNAPISLLVKKEDEAKKQKDKKSKSKKKEIDEEAEEAAALAEAAAAEDANKTASRMALAAQTPHLYKPMVEAATQIMIRLERNLNALRAKITSLDQLKGKGSVWEQHVIKNMSSWANQKLNENWFQFKLIRRQYREVLDTMASVKEAVAASQAAAMASAAVATSAKNDADDED